MSAHQNEAADEWPADCLVARAVRERSDDLALDCPLKRACPIARVEPDVGQHRDDETDADERGLPYRQTSACP